MSQISMIREEEGNKVEVGLLRKEKNLKIKRDIKTYFFISVKYIYIHIYI